MEFSSNDLVFQYQPNSHLSTQLTVKNICNYNQMFKFKASTANRFLIKPNPGSVQPGGSMTIQISIHRQIVQNFQNQKVQMLYGKSLDDPTSHMFKLRIENIVSDLNLTRMVQNKQSRIKQLESQVKDLKLIEMPKAKKKSSKFGLKLLLAIIIGLLIGFYGPIKIFKKKIVYAKKIQ